MSHISEDAILGMPFLAVQQCDMEFQQPVVSINGWPLTCTDRHGELLLSNVQVVRAQGAGGGAGPNRDSVPCRVTKQNYCP